MTDRKLHFTDKKSRSTRRALLRFLKYYDYGFRDIAIEISDIIRRDPLSIRSSAFTIVAQLAVMDFETVAMYDRRVWRILGQIALEYFRRSGTTGGAPFVSILPLKALRAAIGLSEQPEFDIPASTFVRFLVRIRAPDYIIYSCLLIYF